MTELDAEQIQQLIPHRPPFLLVDQVLEIEPGRRIVGEKRVSLEHDDFLRGHFPEYPVMPGVLIVEALAQAGAVLSGLLLATRRGRRRGPSLMRRLAFSPVNTTAGTALLVGWGGAIRVATVPSPAPRARVPWHALTGVEALSRLEGAPRRTQTALSRAAGTASEIVHTVTRSPVMTPAWWSIRLLSAVRAELNDPFTPILAVGAAASAIVGSTVMLRW